MLLFLCSLHHLPGDGVFLSRLCCFCFLIKSCHSKNHNNNNLSGKKEKKERQRKTFSRNTLFLSDNNYTRQVSGKRKVHRSQVFRMNMFIRRGNNTCGVDSLYPPFMVVNCELMVLLSASEGFPKPGIPAWINPCCDGCSWG